MSRRSAYKILLVLVAGILSGSHNILAQPDIIEFEHLTLEDGLSNLRVDAIEQDFMGYMWFGTKRGLCRYNGYDFEVFKSNIFDTASLQYHQIQSLYEDLDHDLWIGTWSGGLHKYNREQNKIERISFASGNINDLSQDAEGYLWVGTNKVLHKYNKKNDKTATYHFWSTEGSPEREVIKIIQSGDKTFVNVSGLGILKYDKERDDFIPVLLLDECMVHNISEIKEVFVYNDRTFWLGTDQGLFEFSPSQGVRLQRMLDGNQKGIYQSISFIINESYKNIWIGADGLYKFDIIENIITQYRHDINNAYSLSNDFVTCGFTDNQKNIWIGTYSSGVNIIKNTSVNFHKNSLINSQLDLFSRNITAITQDKEKNLWIGTWDKGVLIFDEQHQKMDEIYNTFPALRSLEVENIRVLVRGPDESIWIGSSSGLLTQIDLIDRRARVHLLPLPVEELVASLHVTCLLFESDSLLWLGTSGRGLFLFDLHQKRFIPFGAQKQLNKLNILDLERDRNGDLWIAAYQGGVFKMDNSRNISSNVFDEISDSQLREGNFISIYKDSRENLWFGTEFHDLIKLSPNDEISFFPISEEYRNNEITSIQEDHFGKLWLSTTEGLLRFDESTGISRYYTWRDGLVDNEFNYNASFQSEENTIYLGGTNGLVYFTPGSFRDNLIVPPVYIESFFIGNKEVSVNQPDSPLSKPINLTEKITLKYSQNVISFEFVALNYISSSRNQYAYMLEGFDETRWNVLGTRRRMDFTNLDYGNYTLRVKGSNNDGIWNENGASLAIRILPPVWLTWWAFVFYGILLCLTAYLVYKSARQQFRLRQQISRQNYEKEQQAALSNMKLQFFTNISHEFKIPLTLIISPLEEIIRNFKGSADTRQKLQLIHRNSTSLFRLIQLLIDFRKAGQNLLKLELGRHDLLNLARETIQAFQSVVIGENKHMELRTGFSFFEFEFDRDKMERVLYNLIGNAISFTEELCEIIVTISPGKEDQTVCIEVSDTGIGIEEKDLPFIFEEFYQTDHTSRKFVSSTGSGIGLYLCKKIVELHHGTIEVDSKLGKGSRFTVTIPAPDLRIGKEDVHIFNGMNIAYGKEILESLEMNDPPVLPEDAPLVLLVEDHIELRQHIRRMLWNFYRVEEAENGISGLEKAKQFLPDLILSDIMMPVMDGVSMCSMVKKDPKTEHIPVILLSAKSDLESKIEGYEKGADDYLEKPFFPQQLMVRIRNLIESREKLRMHFGDGVNKKPKITGVNPLDREFLEKVFYKIELNLGNSDYNVTELSSELGMSRVHLYRRFKDLTGNTPKDYMIETRLKAAAVLLEENRYTVSEVAYQVGFNTPSNFTASFKSFYGISPKEYKSS